jgi:hypothetical protein
MGGDGTWESFIAEVRKQSRYTWRPDYTAGTINTWIRQGFGREMETVRRQAIHRMSIINSKEYGVSFYTLQGRRIIGNSVL